MADSGFEPLKHEAPDLQSGPFDRLGNPPSFSVEVQPATWLVCHGRVTFRKSRRVALPFLGFHPSAQQPSRVRPPAAHRGQQHSAAPIPISDPGTPAPARGVLQHLAQRTCAQTRTPSPPVTPHAAHPYANRHAQHLASAPQCARIRPSERLTRQLRPAPRTRALTGTPNTPAGGPCCARIRRPRRLTRSPRPAPRTHTPTDTPDTPQRPAPRTHTQSRTRNTPPTSCSAHPRVNRDASGRRAPDMRRPRVPEMTRGASVNVRYADRAQPPLDQARIASTSRAATMR